VKRQGLTSRSRTGTWVVESGAALVGPYDGKSGAQAFASEMRKQGVVATARPLVPEAEARKWAALHAPNRSR